MPSAQGGDRRNHHAGRRAERAQGWTRREAEVHGGALDEAVGRTRPWLLHLPGHIYFNLSLVSPGYHRQERSCTWGGKVDAPSPAAPTSCAEGGKACSSSVPGGAVTRMSPAVKKIKLPRWRQRRQAIGVDSNNSPGAGHTADNFNVPSQHLQL